MTDDRSQMRDGDMPLLDRIESAMRRVTSGQGQMRVPVEATDPDVVLADCKREIERLREALTAANAQAEHFERECVPTEANPRTFVSFERMDAWNDCRDQMLDRLAEMRK